MASVLKTLEALDDAQAQTRVLNWVSVRLGLTTRPLGAQGNSATVRTTADSTPGSTPLREGTVNTVAIKLGASSCRTLLVASAAYLVLYKGQERFTREELINAAKTARMWKSDYGVQTSVNISRMCEADELIEKSKDVYDLSPSKLSELEAKLAD
jgi:hypothetical protein